MNFLQKFFFFLILSSCFLGGSLVSGKITKIKTIYVRPVEVQTSLSRQELQGVAKFSAQPVQIGKIYWTLTDDYGALQWMETIPWDSSFAFKAENWDIPQIKIPLSYDFSEKNIQGFFDVRFFVQNKKNQLMAQGHKRIQVQNIEPQLRISNLSVVRNEDALDVSFLVFQENVSNMQHSVFYPKIDIYEYESGNILSDSFEGEEDRVLGKEKKQIEFSLKTPTEPKRYVLEAQLFDEQDQPLTGTLSEKFLIDGDFAHTEFIHLSSESFLETGKSLDIEIGGMVRNTRTPLLVQATIQQFYNEEKIASETLQKTLSEFTFDDFITSFSVETQAPGATHWKMVIRLLQDDIVLEESAFESTPFSLEAEPEEIVSKNKNFWMWGIGAFFVFFFLSFFLFRFQKKTFLFLLFFSFFSVFSVSADDFGFVPGDDIKTLTPPDATKEPAVGSAGEESLVNVWTSPPSREVINPSALKEFLSFRFLYFSGELKDSSDNGALRLDTEVSVILKENNNPQTQFITQNKKILDLHYNIIRDSLDNNLTIDDDFKTYRFLVLTGDDGEEIPLREYTGTGSYNDMTQSANWTNLSGEYTLSLIFYSTASPDTGVWTDGTNIFVDTVGPELEFEFDDPFQDPDYDSGLHQPWFGRLTENINPVDIFFPNNPDETETETQEDFDTPYDQVFPYTSEYGHFFVSDEAGPLTRVGCRDLPFSGAFFYQSCFNPDYDMNDPGSLVLDTYYFDPYRVKGNFCFDDDSDADTDAYCYDDISSLKPRGFLVCDAVGNCTNYAQQENEIFINFYDPENPTLLSSELSVGQSREGEIGAYPYTHGNGFDPVGEADRNYALKLGVVDPNASSQTLDPSPCENSSQFLPFPSSDPKFCVTQKVPCRRFTASGGSEMVPVSYGDRCQDDYGGGGGPTECCHWRFPYCFPIYFGTPPASCIVSEDCTDGIDNDADMAVDCTDSDCASFPDCLSCNNNGTRDADEGDIDCGGVDCPPCVTEQTCDDNEDNDGDGDVDCDDSDCDTDPNCLTCNNNGFRDGDEEDIDCGGATCPACVTEETCDDGEDNDGDGDVDCDDSDCVSDPVCLTCFGEHPLSSSGATPWYSSDWTKNCITGICSWHYRSSGGNNESCSYYCGYGSARAIYSFNPTPMEYYGQYTCCADSEPNGICDTSSSLGGNQVCIGPFFSSMRANPSGLETPLDRTLTRINSTPRLHYVGTDAGNDVCDTLSCGNGTCGFVCDPGRYWNGFTCDNFGPHKDCMSLPANAYWLDGAGKYPQQYTILTALYFDQDGDGKKDNIFDTDPEFYCTYDCNPGFHWNPMTNTCEL